MRAAGVLPDTAAGEGGVGTYRLMRAFRRPSLDEAWDGPSWRGIAAAAVDRFRPESSAHKPRTRVRLVHDHEGIAGMFRVEDRFVRCIRTGFQEDVFRDSCVEFFVEPRPEGGYFNFEFNCGGAVLASWITDPTRTDQGFKAFRRLSLQDCRRIGVRSSLPPVVEPERTDPLVWTLSFFVPFAVMETYAGSVRTREGSVWRANFYKCADDSSHPHWASWSPVDTLNFHSPRCFGRILFSGAVPSAPVR